MFDFFDYSRVKSSMLYFKNNYQLDNSYLICIRFNVNKNDYEHTTNYKYWDLCEKAIREVFKESLLLNINNDFLILYQEKNIPVNDIIKKTYNNLHDISYQFNMNKPLFNIGVVSTTNNFNNDISKCLACILKAHSENRLYVYDKEINTNTINQIKWLIDSIDNNILTINNIENSDVKDIYSNTSNSLLFDLECIISRIDFLGFKNLCDNYLSKGNYIYNFNPISLIYHSNELVDYIENILDKKLYNNLCINVKYHNNFLNNNELIANLLRLDMLGIKISLEINFIEDNFSIFQLISYLKVSYLKVNKTILVKVMNEKRLFTILKYFYQMCNKLNIKIIFSDIDDEEEITFIKENYPKALYKKNN